MIITRGLEEKFGYPLSKHTRQGYKQLKTKQICYTILMCMFICGWNCTYISGVVEVRHAVAQHVTRQSRVKVKATPRQDYVGIQEMWGRGFISNPFATSALASGWPVSTTPRPLYPRERPSIYCTVQSHPVRIESFSEKKDVNYCFMHSINSEERFFLLLHSACCRVTQLLYQLMHLYKIYTLKH